MIKELVFAILLGALLGFGATGSILTLRQDKKTTSTPPTPTTSISVAPAQTSPTPTPLPTTNNLDLVVDSPKSDTVVSNAKTEIRGLTNPNNLVTMRTPIQTVFTTADNNGSFTADVELDSGVNPIIIISVNPSDNTQSSTTIYLTYSTAKI